jgi:hypothetical protein
MIKACNKIKLQPSDATLDDAKDYYTMLLLDKKLDPIHGQGKITLTRNRRTKLVKIIYLNRLTNYPNL